MKAKGQQARQGSKKASAGAFVGGVPEPVFVCIFHAVRGAVAVAVGRFRSWTMSKV